MAVVILIGNKSTVTLSILSPATTLASFMATDFKKRTPVAHRFDYGGRAGAVAHHLVGQHRR
jgi:ABC-type phosphate transport system permease subunit